MRRRYKAFYNLLDNYESSTGVSETVTAAEKRENTTFLSLAIKTRPMKYCHAYLAAKGKVSSDPAAFRS